MKRLLVLALPLLAACVNTDPAVFVDAALVSPSTSVTGALLGTSVKGQVTLTLHLGARASGPSQVTLGAFTITSSDQSKTLVTSLPVKPNMTSPFTVEPDSDVDVVLTFDTGANLLPKQTKTDLCAGSIAISGVVQDSLQTSQTPVVSTGFTPTCM